VTTRKATDTVNIFLENADYTQLLNIQENKGYFTHVTCWSCSFEW